MPDASTTSSSGGRIYERAGGCLWRLLGDRVLVQLVGHHATPLNLGGAAAVAWVALDEPASRRELVARLDGVGSPEEYLDEAIELLVTESLVEVHE